MSFVNPGDQAGGGGVMPDPCTDFDCGAHGECLAINMTPTCRCDRGFVAVGSVTDDGTRSARCEEPMVPVPEAFYGLRLPDLPEELPGNRAMVETNPSLPVVQPMMSDLGSDGVPRGRPRVAPPADDGPTAGVAGTAGAAEARHEARRSTRGAASCAVSAAGAPRAPGWLECLVLGLIAVARSLRRRG
jgi:hypothetical protein